MAEFATHEDFLSNGWYPNKEADVNFIKNTGAKFIGRAIYRWGKEDALTNPKFWNFAKNIIAELHKYDPEIIFQACAFEAVSPEVDKVKIPAWAFEALGLKPEDRNFSYQKMLDDGGKFVGHWGGRGSVPDITKTETQIWFMFLVGSYLEIGVEAIHLGQIKLMAMNDPNLDTWEALMQKIRKYADAKARRHKIIFDAHTPDGGMVKNGKSLIEFNSFPLRFKEVLDSPLEGVLEVGYSDSLYKRSAGCISPDGWLCESLPYLVEFDNFGISNHPGKADLNDHFIWGYDEITWLYLKPKAEKIKCLNYVFNWLKNTDKNAHLQMPATRVITPTKEGPRQNCRPFAPTKTCPYGMDIEDTIKEIWQKNPLSKN